MNNSLEKLQGTECIFILTSPYAIVFSLAILVFLIFLRDFLKILLRDFFNLVLVWSNLVVYLSGTDQKVYCGGGLLKATKVFIFGPNLKTRILTST